MSDFRTKPMSIGALSKDAGVHIETIRYYEREGILPKARRTRGGHRFYREADVRRLAFIRRSRFTIKEIRSLLSLVDNGDYTCAQIHDLTVQHVDEVKKKIADLRKMEQVLSAMVAQCNRGAIPECPIIDALFVVE